MRIVAVRHGQTMVNVMNEKGIELYGGALNYELSDLTEKGKMQAKELVQNPIIKSIERVYVSDIKRAIETAEYAKPGYKLNLVRELRERSLGIFEGKQKKDLLDSDEYNKYITDENFNKFRLDFKQKAPEGESYTDVSNRVKKFLSSLDFSENITLGVFAHLHSIRCLFLNILKIEPKEKIFKLQIKNCEPYVFEGDSLENLKLISHNIDEMINKKEEFYEKSSNLWIYRFNRR